MHPFAEGVVEQVETSTVLGQSLGSSEEALPSETLSEVSATWLLEDDFRYCDVLSVVVHYHGEVPSPCASDPDASAAPPDYYVDLNGEVH